MSKNNVSLKTIEDLLEMHFSIPTYQRGYRWTTSQVKNLLDDIDSFETEDDKWYCLQPIVVKENKDKEYKWEVIDGQQRLTTIFLIIHYINEKLAGGQEIKEPKISYETRKGSCDFLKGIKIEADNKVKIDNSNIDYYYISSAYKDINDWVNKKDTFNSGKFKEKFMKNTKVIWYEVSPDQDGREIFSRINIGKIPLTNAELIKALFLNSSNFTGSKDEEKIRLKQLEVANEWDNIEYSLHDEEFWYFINKNKNNKETRIEFIFELMCEELSSNNDAYYTFHKFNEKFNEASNQNTEEIIAENWKKVKRYFQILQDWFHDRELYHKIGYLVALGENIKTYIDKYKGTENENGLDKSEFIKYINGEIKSKFQENNIDDIEYPNDSIKEILLLHNIETILNNEKENSRFPFNRYKKEKWDIEHIHAIASKVQVNDNVDAQKQWIDDNYDKNENIYDDEELNKRIIKIISSSTKDDNFEEIIDYILGKSDDNSLGNLCLLDSKTNRSYKNDSFKYKRKEIIDREKKGCFIPICTRNIFMKYYSKKLKQLGQWSDGDRADYLEDIKTVIKHYLPKEVQDE